VVGEARVIDPRLVNLLFSQDGNALAVQCHDRNTASISRSACCPYVQAEEGLARRYNGHEARKRLGEIEVLRARGLSIEQIKSRLSALI
jgi:predicted transcriptional regulator with HTH domain